MYYTINDRYVDFSKVQVMGILNVTPDSFFDGGQYNSLFGAVDRVAAMVRWGAKFIDIGGESTRPGAVAVDENEEVDRVVPVVSAVSKRFDIFISVNTSNPSVMSESAKVGAHIINDIRSLSDKDAIKICLLYPHLSVCLMHMQGSLSNMQEAPFYYDIVKTVDDYFRDQIARCERFGISRDRLFIDPGFGFGKTLKHNYQLLAHLGSFRHFNLPIMVGISRKSMLDVCNNKCPQERLIGSLSGAVISALQGVQILRVHDVKETIEALQVVDVTLTNRKELFI